MSSIRLQKRRGKSKYGAEKVLWRGERFDSRKELERYIVLLDRQKRGEIRNLERQKKFLLIPKQTDRSGKVLEREISYIADFVYEQRDPEKLADERIIEDVKGYKTKEYIIKRKLFLYVYGERIKEV